MSKPRNLYSSVTHGRSDPERDRQQKREDCTRSTAKASAAKSPQDRPEQPVPMADECRLPARLAARRSKTGRSEARDEREPRRDRDRGEHRSYPSRLKNRDHACQPIADERRASSVPSNTWTDEESDCQSYSQFQGSSEVLETIYSWNCGCQRGQRGK